MIIKKLYLVFDFFDFYLVFEFFLRFAAAIDHEWELIGKYIGFTVPI